MLHCPSWLVPQGAECQAVRQGVALAAKSGSPSVRPQIIPIPLGSRPLDRWLPHLEAPPGSLILLLGVAGSLSPQFKVPSEVISTRIQTLQDQRYDCDPQVLDFLRQHLPQTPLGQALSSDRLITQATEKQALGQRYRCDLVEMEGAIVADTLQKKGLQWGMVRVISDDLSHDIPDLSKAFLPNGGLDAPALAATFLKQPLQAIPFIRGSLQALSRLKTIAQHLSQASP